MKITIFVFIEPMQLLNNNYNWYEKKYWLWIRKVLINIYRLKEMNDSH